MMAVCMAFSPPETINTTAEADKTNPQISFTAVGGFKLPLVVCIPNTNVAESAEVMKKVEIKNSVRMINTIDKGRC